ncbi:MAG: NAD(+)/NADH kinase [Bdellovibrionota bacterium]
MQIKRVLVTYKTSIYQKYVLDQKDPIYTKLLAQKHSATKRFQKAHENHIKSIATIKDVLSAKKIQYKVQPRSRSFDENNFDLIVTVGGDGTFLDASQHISQKTIIGVNSNPRDSIGRFCAITASQFVDFLEQLEAGQTKLIKIARLKADLNGELLKPILNDILICNRNPVVTSRYIIQKGHKKEEQKSSGI